MEGDGGEAVESSRWTCEACGCHTNEQSDRTCSICGTGRSGESGVPFCTEILVHLYKNRGMSGIVNQVTRSSATRSRWLSHDAWIPLLEDI